MRYFNKGKLLSAAREHLASMRLKINSLIPTYGRQIEEQTKRLSTLSPEDRYVAEGIIRNLGTQTENLRALYPSPYFIKCIVKFDTDIADRIFYFAKFPFTDAHIYSWTAAAAVLRFVKLGRFSYTGGDGSLIQGTLSYREQYLITDGNILFMAAEDGTHGRELIYQEHFSTRKTEFALPEIVEQMEAAQDKAIRTPPGRNLLITGPAGSGKTTLALHRVAYLLQAPDTAERFTGEQTLVFVNDRSTKAYFAKLLPELGITNVSITTFGDFVIETLGLSGYHLQSDAGLGDPKRNLYVFEKHSALEKLKVSSEINDVWEVLHAAYKDFLSPKSKELFAAQQQHKGLDRFDVTILLRNYLKAHKGLKTHETTYTQLPGGKVRRTKKEVRRVITLLIIDEVQNYTPQQLRCLENLLSPTGSCVYVGDLSQQTKLFTVRDWGSIDADFNDENTIRLEKVYRSTKQILTYIKEQGYPVTIPNDAREGVAAEELLAGNSAEITRLITLIIERNPEVTIGVICSEPEQVPSLDPVARTARVRVLSVAEAQGVEFDVVIYCEDKAGQAGEGAHYEQGLANHLHEVRRDLRYVALTRAMNKLYVIKYV